jgi:cell division septal protein FtsQ
MINRRRQLRKLRWPRRIHLPPRLRHGLLAALCGMSLALSLWYAVPWAWSAIKGHAYFALAPVELGGNRRLSRDEVLQRAGVGAGTSVWDVTVREVRLRLETHPWIERVTVRRELPRRLAIRVRERSPAAIVYLDGLQYVDRSGRILGQLRDDDSRDFPIISGLEAGDANGFTAVAIHRALQLLRWCERLRCFDTISELRVDRQRGITVFPLKVAVPVVLGWGSWREKLVRSAHVFAAWEGQTERLAQVDVSYRNQVVVRLKEEERPGHGRSSKRGTRV